MSVPANSMPSAPVIEVRGVHTRFGSAVVHRGIDFDVNAGDILGMVGGSGSGKTTLLREIVGLLRPTEGAVRLFGHPVLDPDQAIRRSVRRRFGMLFQQGALFSAFSVFDNIAFPLRELRILDEAMIRDLVLLKLSLVELEPRHARLMPAELSGGMIKRVALARALIMDPPLLLLDEPTAGLDPTSSDEFCALLRQLQADLGLTVVMVTHDLDTLFALSSRVAVLAEKRVLVSGTAQEVAQFDHPFTTTFFQGERGRRAMAPAPSATPIAAPASA